MRHLILILFFLLTIKSYGQNLNKGIYKGQRLPFAICYMTYNDSTIEVEYFFKKGGQIFGHFPAKKLMLNMESFSTKPIFKSIDDSISVFIKSDYYLIKKKGFDKFKVYKTTDSKYDINILRNKYCLFKFKQDLHDKLKQKTGFKDNEYWDRINSYELEKYIMIDTIDFNIKLEQTKNDIIINWR